MSISSPERSSGTALDRPTEPSPNEPMPRRGGVRRGRLTHSLLAAALALVATLAIAPFSAAAEAPSGVAQATPTVLAVWALVDGDTPLSHGRVRVYEKGSRSALLQSNGKAQERAHGSGVALLEFARLPSDFTVEVSGARPGGRPLRGTFRAVVHGYTAGRVVHVDPVTTLIAARRQRGRPISAAAARRKIYRLLRVPAWQDQADLRNSDHYFDGDAYLRAARRAGGVAALDRALIREELRRGDRSRRFVTRRGPAARASKGVDWLGLLAGDPSVLVKEAFKAVALLAGQKIAGLAAEKAGNAALGWVLAAFGFGDVLKDQDMAEIKLALSALGKQLTQVQGQVQLAGFSTLVHQTDRTIGQIDHASSQLALLANMPANDPTKAAFTSTIVGYIGANLLDAPAILNQNLGTAIPLSDNLLKSASRVVAQRGRFFDRSSSQAIRSVYDYFSAYQVKLAILLTEYFHAKPEIYSATNVTATLNGVEANVRAQEGSLKPTVPANAVIDTKTNRMWTQDYEGPAEVNMHEVAEIYKPSRGRAYFRTKQPYGLGPKTIPGLPHGNWLLPSSAAFEQLVEGWSGANPAAWLHSQAHISNRLLDAGGGQMWIRDYHHFIQGTWPSLQPYVFDLRRGERRARPFFSWFFENGWKEDFTAARAGRLFHRDLDAGENYWWGG
jgi:hypothetical protein